MSSYDNIKPYAEFSHTAALNGGIDSYLEKIEKASYDEGVSDTIGKAIKLLPVGVVAAIGLWESGKWVYRQGQIYFAKRKEADVLKVEAAKAAIKKGVKAAENAGLTNEDTLNNKDVQEDTEE